MINKETLILLPFHLSPHSISYLPINNSLGVELNQLFIYHILNKITLPLVETLSYLEKQFLNVKLPDFVNISSNLVNYKYEERSLKIRIL